MNTEYDLFQKKIIKNIKKGEENMNGTGISFDDDVVFGNSSPVIAQEKKVEEEIVLEKAKQKNIEEDFPSIPTENQTLNKIIKQDIMVEEDFPKSAQQTILSPVIEKKPDNHYEKKETSSRPIEKASFSAEDFEKFKKDITENIDDVKKEIKQDVKSLVDTFAQTLQELQESIKIISNVSKPISELNVLVETQFEKMKGSNEKFEENLFKKLNNISQSIDTEIEKNEKYIEEHESFFKSTNYAGLRNGLKKESLNIEKESQEEETNENEDFEDMGVKKGNQKSRNNKGNQKQLGFFGKFLAKIGF